MYVKRVKRKETPTNYQCRRKVCKKADMPSMAIRIATVKVAQKPKVKKIITDPR